MRFVPRLSVLIVCLLAWVQPARAEVITVTGPTDIYFTFEEQTIFKVRTYAQQYGIDSMLWLYGSDNTLIAQNDDYYGLDSWLEVDVPAGQYRLRTGVCCGNPEAWYGTSYTLDTNSAPVPPSTTTTSTTSTVPETTTTQPQETTTTWPNTTTSTTTTTTSTTTAPETTVLVTTLPPEPSTSTSSPTIPTTSTVVPSTTTTSSLAPTTSLASTTSTTTIPPTSSPTSTPTSEPEPTTPPTTDPTPNEALTSVLADPTVFDDLSETEVTELIAEIAGTELTDEQAAELAEVLSEAPDEVKAEFEEQINVFGGQFDTYVPVGSTVPVGTRRTLVAVTATTMVAMPSPTSRRNT